MNTIESIYLIYRNPKIRGGRPCIVGTGLRVLDVVMAMIFAERSPDQLAQDFELSMAEVHAALAYYYCNKDEIDEDIREDIRRSDELVNQGFAKPEKPVYQPLIPSPDQTALHEAVAQAFAKAHKEIVEDTAERVLELMEKEVE